MIKNKVLFESFLCHVLEYGSKQMTIQFDHFSANNGCLCEKEHFSSIYNKTIEIEILKLSW